MGNHGNLEIKAFPSENSSYFFLKTRLNDSFGFLEFHWMKKGKSKLVLPLAITSETEAVSLPMAPFGGIWSRDSADSEILDQFLSQVLEYLAQKGISTFKLIQAPKPYVPQTDLIQNILFKSGFEVKEILSHQFFLGKKKIKAFVKEGLSKYLKKVKSESLLIKSGSISNFNFLDEIKSWNTARGYQITFDETSLIQQVSEFPDRYFLISIHQSGRSLANALVVKQTSDSLYYYLAASDPKSTVKSLGEILLFELFQLAVKEKSEFVDLGSSETNQGLNHSLIFFKSRFSNDISNKIIWSKKINL